VAPADDPLPPGDEPAPEPAADPAGVGGAGFGHAGLDRLGLQFLAEFLEVARRHRPENLETLAELGHVYTRLGRFTEGLDIDRLLVRLVPDNPTAHYNLACSLALCGEPGPAISALEAAVGLGYDDAAHLAADEDLRSLREDPRFRALLTRLGHAGG
jgi:cytochrome c-type biogenesis protein CcmH/NrfG